LTFISFRGCQKTTKTGTPSLSRRQFIRTFSASTGSAPVSPNILDSPDEVLFKTNDFQQLSTFCIDIRLSINHTLLLYNKIFLKIPYFGLDFKNTTVYIQIIMEIYMKNTITISDKKLSFIFFIF
jgi:hypothetical protein